MQIVTSVPVSQLEDEATANGLVEKLLNDSEIGPALKEQYGDDFNASDLLASEGLISSRATNAHLSLSKFASHLRAV